ncbi:WD repeat-containing protein 73 [Arapaima gigas]
MEERADEDEWLIESLRRYSDLHVFELQEPTRVIEWTSDKSVCVAGYRAAKKHDILELLLPQKLSAKDNRGLCPERDFKVQHGGFSQEPVNCLKYILGTRCVVTSGDPGSSLQLWQIAADDSDAIKKTGYIHVKRKGKTTRKLASGLGGAPAVLHGSQIGDVQLTDLTSGQALYTAGEDSSDAVGALRFVDASVFLVCAESGELRVGDVREPSALRRAAAAGEQGESCCCMDLKDGAVARLFSTAQVVVSDLRDLRRPLSQARLNIRSGAASSHFLTVSWAPALHNCLSVSGE